MRTPAFLLGLLYLCFFGSLPYASAHLPAQVATHFNASGQPNGWMNRDSHLWHIMEFGIIFPWLVPAIFYFSRFLPDRLYHISNHDYWFAPTRRSETLAYLFRHSLWFASLALGFVIGIHISTIHANLGQAQLSPPLVFTLAGGFLAGIIFWAASVIRYFKRVPRQVVKTTG